MSLMHRLLERQIKRHLGDTATMSAELAARRLTVLDVSEPIARAIAACHHGT